MAEFSLMSHVTLHLAGSTNLSTWSQVTPLAEQFKMVQYQENVTFHYFIITDLDFNSAHLIDQLQLTVFGAKEIFETAVRFDS